MAAKSKKASGRSKRRAAPRKARKSGGARKRARPAKKASKSARKVSGRAKSASRPARKPKRAAPRKAASAKGRRTLRGPKGRPGGGDGVEFGGITFDDPTGQYSPPNGKTSVQSIQLQTGTNAGPFGTNVSTFLLVASPNDPNPPTQGWRTSFNAPPGQVWQSVGITFALNPAYGNWIPKIQNPLYAPAPPSS